MKKIIGFVVVLLLTASCMNPRPRARKFVCRVSSDDTTIQYRAYLLTTGAVGNSHKLATAADAIEITVFENNEEKLLKTYKGVKYTMMTLDPGVFLIVHVHDGKNETIDTIMLK